MCASSFKMSRSKPGHLRRPPLGLERFESRMALATLPAGFSEAVVGSGLTNATAMAVASDGRIFVTQQGGSLRVVKNGATVAQPALTLDVNSAGERGLLGVALDPFFATNQFVYVYYTTGTAPIHNRVSRFTLNGDSVVPGSERVLLELNNLSSATNHNGGALHFGADGKLYIGVGDNANGSNAQSLNNLLGKVLRINRDGSIPSDNPFFNSTTGQNRAIWALGLRNPFTFAVQPGTGRIFINDVGQNTWEEINPGVPGGNYGWPATEGPTTDPRFVAPLFAYQHSAGTPTGIAISGGAFYNPANRQFPADYAGDYFFADYGEGWIYRYDTATDSVQQFAQGSPFSTFPVDLGTDADGNLFYLARGDGQVQRVRFANGNSEPVLRNFGGHVTYQEGAAQATIVSPTVTVSDADSVNFAGGKLKARLAVNAGPADFLKLRNTASVSVVGDQVRVGGVTVGTYIQGNRYTPLVVTFNAQATPARVQAVLRSVSYFNISNAPSTKLRTVAVQVSDGDGGISLAAVKQIRVIPVNTIAASTQSSMVGYPQNAAAVLLSPLATIAGGPLNFVGGRLQAAMTTGADASNRLSVGGPFSFVDKEGELALAFKGVTVARVESDGQGLAPLIVTLNEAATPSVIEQFVRSLRFRTINGSNFAPRTIAVTFSDGNGQASELAHVTVNLKAVGQGLP